MEHQADTRVTVAAEVRAVLARAGRSATWLAVETNISKASLSRKLRGETSFTVEELVAVCGALGIDDPAMLVPAGRADA